MTAETDEEILRTGGALALARARMEEIEAQRDRMEALETRAERAEARAVKFHEALRDIVELRKVGEKATAEQLIARAALR